MPGLIKGIRDCGDTVEAVYLGREVNTEEVDVQKRLDTVLGQLQCPIKLFEGKSWIHSTDLPFPVEQLPDVFTHFRKQVERPDMFREPVQAPSKLKPFPKDVSIPDSAGLFPLSTKKEEEVEKHLLKPLLEQPALAHNETRCWVQATVQNSLPPSLMAFSRPDSSLRKPANWIKPLAQQTQREVVVGSSSSCSGETTFISSDASSVGISSLSVVLKRFYLPRVLDRKLTIGSFPTHSVTRETRLLGGQQQKQVCP